MDAAFLTMRARFAFGCSDDMTLDEVDENDCCGWTLAIDAYACQTRMRVRRAHAHKVRVRST